VNEERGNGCRGWMRWEGEKGREGRRAGFRMVMMKMWDGISNELLFLA
jgi:hypothetical protein